jgi:hypothetical protein
MVIFVNSKSSLRVITAVMMMMKLMLKRKKMQLLSRVRLSVLS